jgi:phenylacetate-coenzyme A ligase PaaK-like adenylate-forming protein
MLASELYYLSKVFRQDRYPTQKLKKLQLFFLNELISAALKNPFYQEHYRGIVNQGRPISGFSDFYRLPMTDKMVLLESNGKFYANALGKGYMVRETSSIGHEKFSIYLDDEGLEYNNAIFLRSLMRQGYNPLSALGFYWYRKEANSIFTKLGICRKELISHDMSPETILSILAKSDIRYLFMFPYKLLEFSNNIQAQKLKKLKLKKIFIIGEPTSERMIDFFLGKFGCDVVEYYGLTEFNIVACRKDDGYEINADNVLLETVYDKAYDLNRIVLTSFSNHITPIIRYDTGDYCIFDSKLKKIIGKKDNIITIGGKRHYLQDLVDIMISNMENIYMFCFGIKDGMLHVNVIRKKWHMLKKEDISKLFPFRIQINFVDRLEFLWSGKFNMLVKD